jgi:hypothetical protein
MKICGIKCKSKSSKGFSPTTQGGEHSINECPFYVKNNDFGGESHVTKSIDCLANGQHVSLPDPLLSGPPFLFGWHFASTKRT